MNAPLPAKLASQAEIMETVLIKGDLSKLDTSERNQYYFSLCESIGLNPLTQPLEYITLNGKLRLYAKKDCTEQLRVIHNVSVTDLSEKERDGVFIVTAKVMNGDGRSDIATGAVNIKGLSGEVLANALMKAETKAKRRATLSICGLGFLDETEVDDIPANQKTLHPSTKRDSGPPSARIMAEVIDIENSEPHEISTVGERFPSWTEKYIAAINATKEAAAIHKWIELNRATLDRISEGAPNLSAKIKQAETVQLEKFRASTKPDKISSGSIKAATPNPADPEAVLKWIDETLAAVKNADDLATVYTEKCEPLVDALMPPDRDECMGVYHRHEKRLEP